MGRFGGFGRFAGFEGFGEVAREDWRVMRSGGDLMVNHPPAFHVYWLSCHEVGHPTTLVGLMWWWSRRFGEDHSVIDGRLS